MRLIPGYVYKLDLKIRTVCVRGSGYGISKVSADGNRRNRHVGCVVGDELTEGYDLNTMTCAVSRARMATLRYILDCRRECARVCGE